MGKKVEEVRHIDLQKDLTQTQLMHLLNNKFGGKNFTTKEVEELVPFNQRDVQGYVRRQKLPEKYGGYSIKVIRSKDSGMTFLRIDEIEKIKDLPDFKD